MDKPPRPRLTKPKTDEERKAEMKAMYAASSPIAQWIAEAKDG